MAGTEHSVLVDENVDWMVSRLRQLGYSAEGVKAMQASDPLLKHDFNVILRAKERGMVLVTKDKETGEACLANGIDCILINDDTTFELMVLPELKRLCSRDGK